MLNKFKSMAIEGYVKNKFPNYFENGEFSVVLNTGTRTCSIKTRLAGEETPMQIEVANYEVLKVDGQDYICIKEISADRAWMNAMLADYLVGKQIPIPSIAATALGE